MKCVFLLNIDICQPGPSVHLLKDIITKVSEDSANEVVVISKSLGQEKIKPAFVEKDNITLVKIGANSEKLSFVKRYIYDVIYAKKCVRFYKGINADVVFLQSCNTAFFHLKFLKKHTRAKILYNVQDIFPENLKYMKKLPFETLSFPIFSFLQKCAYKMADSIITISEDMAGLIKASLKNKSKVGVIHNWGYSDRIDCVERTENPFYVEKIFDEKTFNVVYAGNIGLVQNVEIIAKTAHALRDNAKIHFYLIGEGARKTAIEKYAAENALTNITFLPMQDETKAPFLYSAADVNIIPLAPNIIKTALPSKTPACLASGRYLIACIEKYSEFARVLDKAEGCFVADNQSEAELTELIKTLSLSDELFFGDRQEALGVFSSEKNPIEYVRALKSLI